MTTEELQALVTSLAISAANNENQSRAMLEGLASLQTSAEIQARSIEAMRESWSFNTETVASSLEIAAEALKLSASTSRAIDRSEQNITRLEQMVEIIIKDNQADRARISGLEGQS